MQTNTAATLIFFFCAGFFFAQTGPSPQMEKGPEFGITLSQEDFKLFAAMDKAHKSEQYTDMSQTLSLNANVPIRMTCALDHHRTVSSILLNRAAAISSHAKQDVVILVAGGPVPDGEKLTIAQR